MKESLDSLWMLETSTNDLGPQAMNLDNTD